VFVLLLMMTSYEKEDEDRENALLHGLSPLILDAKKRRAVLIELRETLIAIDQEIVEQSKTYLKEIDISSMAYQTVRTYLSSNECRNPLYIAINTIDTVLKAPNFMKEFYIILVIFVQFKDVVKKYIAPLTPEPVFSKYFNFVSFYSRFITIMPNNKNMQTVTEFIHNEFSLFLTSINSV